MTSIVSTQHRSADVQHAVQNALIVIDTNVGYVSTLVADIVSSHADILLLSADRDGIAQITEALEKRSHLSSLHIVSHGSPGCLHLGNAKLSFETLAQHSKALETWTTLLKDQDILLYGCQVAKGALGHLLLQQLQQLTGANIAASSQRVGRVGDHTNWVLDTQLGTVHTPVAFSNKLQATYAGHFDPVVDFSLSTDTLIESEGTPFSFIFELSEAPPADGTVIRFESTTPQAINQWDLFSLSTTGLADLPVDVSPALDFSAFEITIIEQRATIDLPVFNDFIDDSPESFTWNISAVSGGTVGNDTAMVTIYDDPSEVPSTPTIPEVSITSDVTTLVEDEGTEVTLTITLSEPPDGALLIDINTGKPFALGDFDIFPPDPQASATGGQLVRGNADNSGFTFAVTTQTATITLPVFDDPDRTENGSVTDPDGPLRNDDQGEEQTTFTIATSDSYTIAPSAGSVTLTLKDTNVVNSDPVADDDSYSTAFDTALTVDAATGVLDGDTDADGDTLSVAIETDPSNGSATLNADGSFTYTPNAGFSGDDTFTYTLSDGNGGSDTATVTVSVAGAVNSDPVADDDSYSTAFNTALTVDAATGVLDGDTDADGDTLSAAIATDPSNGTVAINADGSFVYTPDAGFSGDDTFTYTLSDGNGGTDTASVNVTVNPEVVVIVPQVSLTTSTNFSGTENALVEDEGTSLTFQFDLDTVAPTGGLRLFVDSDITQIVNRLDLPGFAFNPTVENIDPQSLNTSFDNSGFALTINEGTTSATFTIDVFDNPEPDTTLPEVFDGRVDAEFSLKTQSEVSAEDAIDIAGISEYTIDAAAASSTVIFVDTQSQLGGGNNGDGPIVTFTTDTTSLVESDGGFVTLQFNVDGDIPPVVLNADGQVESGGLEVALKVNTTDSTFDPGVFFVDFQAGDFEFESNTPSIFDPGNIWELKGADDGTDVGLGLVKDDDIFAIVEPPYDTIKLILTENTASIRLPVLDDVITEDEETIGFALQDGDGYTVADNVMPVAVTITDGDPSVEDGPTVGLSASSTAVTEGEEITFTIDLDQAPPPEGLRIRIASGLVASTGEFDVSRPKVDTDGDGIGDTRQVLGVELTGVKDEFSIQPNEDGSGFFVTVVDQQATIKVTVADDGFAEGTESFTYSVIEGEDYNVSETNGSVTFTIDDAVNGGGPVVVTDSDSVSTNNDIIANAQTIDLSADNPLVQVQADISQRFEDRTNTVDATEDVDMFAVQLKAGERIAIDADTVPVDFEGFPTGPAPDITIFNAAGEKIVVGTDAEGEDIFAFSSRDAAPDEAFVAGRDGYLEFTATEDGTYYIGASQYRNSNYDPNVVGSGSGAIFSPRFGVGPGSYTLDIALNPEGFKGEVYEEFTGTPTDGAPIVSLTAVPGTFGRDEERNDVVISSELIESEDGAVGIVDFTFNIEGEIPDGGLEVLVKSDADLSAYFDGTEATPRVGVGGTLTGGLYDVTGALIGFKALITANNARFPLNAASDREDDPNAPETLTFSLANSADYVASETAASSDITFYDTLAQVQATGGPVPEVGLTFDQTQFIETEGTEGTLTVTVTGEVPTDGLLVYIDGEERVLGEFDVFNAEVSGGAFPAPNGNASGFFFRVFENTATIKLTVFDETTNDQIPAEDALEGIENFSLSIQPSDTYTIDAAATTIDFTILDNPDSVVIPDGGGEEPTDPMEPTGPIDTDSRSEINDTLETAVATGLTADNKMVSVEGSIDVRWRNSPEQRADNTEDVDIYSFELAAGEKVNINSTSVPFELNGIDQTTAATLRLFNAAGEELALSATTVEAGAVTDAAALEYTATEAGTYYVGVSQYLNDNYDPLVNASGDGVQLVNDGISPGAYTLNLVLESGDVMPTTPVVSFSTTSGTISEAEGSNLVMNFAVTGDIPPEGITVKLKGDAARIMQQFTAAQTRFDSETGEIFYRFDKGLVNENVVGGELQLFSLEDGDASEGSADPAAAGDAFLSDFTFTITEANASITIPVFDDILEEGDATFTYTLLEGEGYSVDTAANTGTFTVTDGVAGGVGPTVGVTATPQTLIESEQTVATVTFNTVGDIPAEGLVVQLASSVRAIAEFDINATNPRLPESETVVEGVTVDGGSIVGTDNVAGSVFFRITAPTATITVPVFQDDVTKGTENLTFNLLDGEAYEIDAATSSINFSIEDGGGMTPDIIGTDTGETLVGTDEKNIIDALGDDDIVAGDLDNDIIDGGDGDDVLRGDRNSRSTQDGQPGGNDIIFGGNGNDRIGGKGGNDVLSGDAGDDFIWGDDGDDIIMGATGNDVLVGDNFSNGNGSDLFVFGNGDGTDTIKDFEVGIDRIGLVEGELTFADLTLTQEGRNTLLGVTSSGETLAVLNNVQVSALDENSFAIVPDVSNPQEALQLI